MGFGSNYKRRCGNRGCERSVHKGRNIRGDFNKAMDFPVIPNRLIPLGYFNYKCENDIVCKVEIADVPYFNAPIYLENKEVIGKVDEIFGKLRDYSVTIKLSPKISSNSFVLHQKLFIEPNKLLPFNKFLPKSYQPKIKNRNQSSRRNRDNVGGNSDRYRNDGNKMNKSTGNNNRKYNYRSKGGRMGGMNQQRLHW